MVDQQTPTRAVSRPGVLRSRLETRNDSRTARRIPAHPDTVPAAIGASAECPSWYVANFAPTAGQTAGPERRTARWALRGLLRQAGVSALPRVAKCGTPIGDQPVRVKRDSDGGAHVSGHETCASVWSCPVCAASIRQHRAEEITRGLAEHLRKPTKDERKAGRKASGLPATRGGAVLVTLTLPHQAGDALARTVEMVSASFRAMQSGRAYAAERSRYGVLGYVRAFEITHGADNGWHPHLHLILVTAARLTDEACREMEAAWLARWNRVLTGQGWPAASAAHGVRFDLVRRDAAAVAVYVAKLQEGDATKPGRRTNVANEVTRADLKSAKGGGLLVRGAGGVAARRVPFEILADFGTDGAAEDLDLWHEYQLATKGRSAIRWSRGLRALLLPEEEELTDEQVTEQAAEADDVAVIAAPLYRAIAARPYGEAFLLVACERGGLDGIRRYVRGLGLDPGGVHAPEAWLNFAELRELDNEREDRA